MVLIGCTPFGPLFHSGKGEGVTGLNGVQLAYAAAGMIRGDLILSQGP